MTRKTAWIANLSLVTMSLAGCGGSVEPAGGTVQPSAGGAMPGMPQAAQGAAEHRAEGTLNSVNTNAGTVNITHGPVTSANWPAMTMSFKLADSAALAGLEPGDRIRFQFTIEGGMAATVTEITAME